MNNKLLGSTNIDSGWMPALIRLTIFTENMQDSLNKYKSWWENIINTPADKIEEHPKTQQALIEAGFISGKIQLQISPLRVDWIYRVVDTFSEDGTFATLDEYKNAINDFTKISKKLLENCPIETALRLAYGSVLLQPVSSLKEGYEKLSPYLKNVTIDTENSSDLLYQINRPRISEKVQDIKINRLSKWTILRVETSTFVNDVSAITNQETFACHLEIDLSTAKEDKVRLGLNDLSILFDELVSLGDEIALKGDIS